MARGITWQFCRVDRRRLESQNGASMSRRLLLLAALAAPLLAQSREEFWSFLESRARAVTARAFEETASAPVFDRVRARRLEELRDMLGLLPWPERTPLKPVITGTLDRGDYV